MKLTGKHNFLSPEAGLVSDEVLRSPFMAWETKVIIAGRREQSASLPFPRLLPTSFCLHVLIISK